MSSPVLTRIELDVSELEAPEPMRLILVALAQLETGQYLAVSHRKEPLPLYPKLTEMGFAYSVYCDDQSSAQPHYLIAIGHSDDADAIKAMTNQM